MNRPLRALLLAASLIFASNFETGDFSGWDSTLEGEVETACARPWPEPTPWCAISPDPMACDDTSCSCQTVCNSEPSGVCWFSAQLCL